MRYEYEDQKENFSHLNDNEESSWVYLWREFANGKVISGGENFRDSALMCKKFPIPKLKEVDAFKKKFFHLLKLPLSPSQN